MVCIPIDSFCLFTEIESQTESTVITPLYIFYCRYGSHLYLSILVIMTVQLEWSRDSLAYKPYKLHSDLNRD